MDTYRTSGRALKILLKKQPRYVFVITYPDGRVEQTQAETLDPTTLGFVVGRPTYDAAKDGVRVEFCRGVDVTEEEGGPVADAVLGIVARVRSGEQ